MNSILSRVKDLFLNVFLGHDSPDIDQHSIGMLCYSCESPKENSECQTSPNQTTTTMCESKQQICYTKRTTNTAGKQLSFVRSYLCVSSGSRKTTTVQSWLFGTTTSGGNGDDDDSSNGQFHSTITMSVKQSRRKNRLRQILSHVHVQHAGHKVTILVDQGGHAMLFSRYLAMEHQESQSVS